jgi:hypothetical protein
MKSLLVSILLAVSPAAFGQDTVSTVQQEARKCVKALLTGKFEEFVAYTHSRVVTASGGKDAMVTTMKRGTEEMRAQGSSIEDAKIGQPDKPQKIGDWLVSLIPEHIRMKVTGGHLDQDSYLLGISEDDGKHWTFVDVGPMTKESFELAFPELAGKISLPEKRESVFKKDAKKK